MNLIQGMAECGCRYSGEQSGSDFTAEDGRMTHFFFVEMSNHCPSGHSHGTQFGDTAKRFQMLVHPPELASIVDSTRNDSPNLRLELHQPRTVIQYDVDREEVEGVIVGRWPL